MFRFSLNLVDTFKAVFMLSEVFRGALQAVLLTCARYYLLPGPHQAILLVKIQERKVHAAGQ